MRTGRISHQADGKPRGDQPTLLAVRRRFSASSARRRSITSVDTCRHHPRRSAIALLGAALALTAAACSDDGASTATTSEPTATTTTPAATTTEAATTTPASTVTTEPAADGAIAEQVDVDGQKLFLECRGTGSPTVVLQSGYGNAGDIWSVTDTSSPAVFPALAETNRVCIYDRPGSMITTTNASGTPTLGETPRPGRSGAVPTAPRDPAEVVTELHDLLTAADVPGPYVLVGHSLGGAFDLLYAVTYPDEVAALVVVDSPLPPSRDNITPEVWESVRMKAQDPSLVPGYELESYDLGTLFDEIEAAGTLPDIPVVVIRRGDGAAFSDDDTVPEGAPFTQAEVDAINTAQWEAQAQWAAGVPGAEVITVPDTTHYVQNQRPDAVVDAIRSVIARG